MLKVIAEEQKALAERQERQEKLIEDCLAKVWHQEATQLAGE